MKPRSLNDPYHNPFRNRFHVPVHSRLDEMQAYTHIIWLNDQTQLEQPGERNQSARYWLGAVAGAFTLLLIVVFSAAWLTNTR
jgi:hypothetical protein